ncbi:MAG: osmotically inducible protein OsmC [Bacillus thermozeamaize]|jgi:uncharacterized OsmC-like protein|uniref:Osmotically inducible protein OsmC n=1 Tax=Bacillus thermozeamaize TaxID=230954 RepID=A0A1Y3Q103_9BACI|nr:MAG: osmotically inducible protein OsmC [Bacillus thermozeamaize]
MSGLQEYLSEKKQALQARREKIIANGAEPFTISAHVKAEGRCGVRRIRIRDFQIISDSDTDFAGYNLGPSSPEIQLGVLGSCLTHIFLIQASDRGIPLDSLEVEVTGQLDPRANHPGYEHVPVYPHNIHYTVRIASPADDAALRELHAAVERTCPILNLLAKPQQISGTLVHISDGKEAVSNPPSDGR